MEKELYTIIFKDKKEKEIIENVGGEIVKYDTSTSFEKVYAKLTEEMVQILKESPKIKHVRKYHVGGGWDYKYIY